MNRWVAVISGTESSFVVPIKSPPPRLRRGPRFHWASNGPADRRRHSGRTRSAGASPRASTNEAVHTMTGEENPPMAERESVAGNPLLHSIDDACRRLSMGRSWLYRSEEHTSELQSLMRISYAVFCLKK